MKKVIALILALTLLIGNTAFASTTEDRSSPKSLFQAPTIKSAKYYHENAYVSMLNNTLSIIWEKVDKAQSYEILITKADGQRKIYKTSASYNCLLVEKSSKDSFSGCPTVYCEKLGVWESATVRIRAVYKYGIRGRWSKKKTISCNVLHGGA